jgi:hypothetical protein
LPDLNHHQLGLYARCARDYGDVVPLLGPTTRRALPSDIEDALVRPTPTS